MKIPDHLVDEILAGHCVAFIGAGFAMPTVPNWRDLLVLTGQRMAATYPAAATVVDALAPKPDSTELEMVAQQLEQLDRTLFQKSMQASVPSLDDPSAETVRKRLRALADIPFAAILTTNFDGYLTHHNPPDVKLSDVLRPSRGVYGEDFVRAAFNMFAEEELVPLQQPVYELHGRLGTDNVIISRLDYRRRLYQDPLYLQFLKVLFATRTVLFLGFSFTDAYIRLLREEVLALLDETKRVGAIFGDHPIAYALMADVPVRARDFSRQYEGLEILSYDSSVPPYHQEFDQFLHGLRSSTSARHRIGTLLEGKEILWLDPNPINNARGIEFLNRACGPSTRGPVINASGVDDAIGRVMRERYDLVISHWGHRAGQPSNCEEFLARMHAAGRHLPTIVFATDTFADENKVRALNAGALDFVFSWGRLFEQLEWFFKPGTETG